MKYTMREIPKMERPRERLLKYGAKALADYELLAIILRTGTKEESVLEVARNLTMHFPSLNALNEVTLSELQKIRGIGTAKAIELLALGELGRRISTPQRLKHTIASDRDAYFYLKQKLTNLSQEQLMAVYLNTRNEVIEDKVISVGTLDRTVFHPRDILKWALKYNAYALIMAHNHPSGDASPSDMDLKMTKLMIESAKTMGIVFIDHLIIGNNQYYSFAKKQKQVID
jgi:DNA repair protein RadC